MSELGEASQIIFQTGQAFGFAVGKISELTKPMLEAILKLIKMLAVAGSKKFYNDVIKKQPGAVSYRELRNPVPIRINEKDLEVIQKTFKDAKIEYSPLPDLNKNDQFAEILVNRTDLERVASVVDRLGETETIDKDSFNIITYEEYANNIDDEELQKTMQEYEVSEKDLDRVETPRRASDIKTLRNQVLRDEFASGKIEPLTITEKLLVKEVSNEKFTTFRVPKSRTYEKEDQFITFQNKDIVETDGGKTFLCRLDKEKDYSLCDREGNKLRIMSGENIRKTYFDRVKRDRFRKTPQVNRSKK